MKGMKLMKGLACGERDTTRSFFMLFMVTVTDA